MYFHLTVFSHFHFLFGSFLLFLLRHSSFQFVFAVDVFYLNLFHYLCKPHLISCILISFFFHKKLQAMVKSVPLGFLI